MNMSRSVFVLKSGKCSWSKCIVCGYAHSIGDVPSHGELKKRFDSFFAELKPDTSEVCVFGSGSFLDDGQVPIESREYFISECAKRSIKKITIESRPEYISWESLRVFRGLDFTVAIGLESSSDKTLTKIAKGFKVKDFEEAAEKIHESGGKARAYLLVNQPHVKDYRKSLDPSVEYALKHADSIVLLNTLPHANAPMFDLWVRGEWSFLTKTEFYEATKKWADNPKIELDAETFKFTPKFPKRLEKPLVGVSEEYLTHPYFEVWQDWLIRWYEPPKTKKTLLFLPCAYRKPYSESETHKKIISALEETGKRGTLHEVMLSSAGVIPREFEDRYPFNAYDWEEKKETPEIKKRYVQVTEERIIKYLLAHEEHYVKLLCYLKYDSESYQALEKAAREAGLNLTNLLSEGTYKKIRDEKKPLTREEALKELSQGIKNEVR